jgi:hypothetical protein
MAKKKDDGLIHVEYMPLSQRHPGEGGAVPTLALNSSPAD